MNDLFENYIQNESILFKHAKGKSSLIGKEFHNYHEIILFLGGKAKLITEKFQTDIFENNIIVVPKESYHQLKILEDENNYHRCIFNFKETKELVPLLSNFPSSPEIITCNDFIISLANRLIACADKETRVTMLEATIVLILNEIKNHTFISKSTQNKAMSLALEYINNHISEKINVEILARECNLSPSSLSHLFKNQMQISIHQYIIKKRLILAHSMIASGTPAYTACIDSGFTDYSGFYRQYKKVFGCSPSKSK